jgi:hypothetical protein
VSFLSSTLASGALYRYCTPQKEVCRYLLPCCALREGFQFEQLLELLQPKERAAIVTHFKCKFGESNACSEEEKHCDGENETDQKKEGLQASAGGLAVHVAGGSGDGSQADSLGCTKEGVTDLHSKQHEEEKTKIKNKQMLAHFFHPVRRQIAEIVSDVSPTALYLCKVLKHPDLLIPPHCRLATPNTQWRSKKQKLSLYPR